MSAAVAAKKKWKAKFPGQTDDGEEDPYITAQRFINVYRQMHVLRSDLVTRYNDMLLSINDDVRLTLNDIPGGHDVMDYLEYLEVEKYGEAKTVEKEVEISEEEKARAKAIADAMAAASEKMGENQARILAQAQEDSRRQMEELTRSLADARANDASSEEVQRISSRLQTLRSEYDSYNSKINEYEASHDEQSDVMAKMRAQ